MPLDALWVGVLVGGAPPGCIFVKLPAWFQRITRFFDRPPGPKLGCRKCCSCGAGARRLAQEKARCSLRFLVAILVGSVVDGAPGGCSFCKKPCLV